MLKTVRRSLDGALRKLERDVAEKGASYAALHALRPGEAVTEADLAAAEQRLGVRYPPSYREFMLKFGLFSLGDPGAEHDHLVFRAWPLAEHRTALTRVAEEELECSPTAKAVAEELGLEEDVVAVLGETILVGCEGHEDFVGFDLRTRGDGGECAFGLCSMDDSEIEALAEKKASPCDARGFDQWLAKHINRRRQ